MNCSTCNFPYPPHELKVGLCFDCLAADRKSLQLELMDRDVKIESMQIMIEEIRLERDQLKATMEGLHKQVSDLLALVKIETYRPEVSR